MSTIAIVVKRIPKIRYGVVIPEEHFLWILRIAAVPSSRPYRQVKPHNVLLRNNSKLRIAVASLPNNTGETLNSPPSL